MILRGEVGAGKTTLVKGIAAALGAAAEDEVTSPTFTIVHEYVGTKVRLFHLDLYRLETEEQIAVLGLDEMAGYENSLVLVEWGERFESVVKMAGGEIYMEHGEGDERGLTVRLKNVGGGLEDGAFGAAGVAVDGALFVAGGAVFLLAGDGFEVGGVVFGGHFDVVEEELGEGGIAVEDVGALGVDVDEVEAGCSGGLANWVSMRRRSCLRTGASKGWKRKSSTGVEGKSKSRASCSRTSMGARRRRGGVGLVGFDPVVDVGAGDGGEVGVELDADDFAEAEFAGDEQAAAFAGTDVDEGVAGDGVGGDGLAPLVDEGAQDAGRDAVVGGDVLVVGVAGDEVLGGDEAAGVDAVHLVEGMDGEAGELEQVAGARLGGCDAKHWFCLAGFGSGRGHSRASSMVFGCRDGRGLRGRCGRDSRRVR